jgi:AAHS family benzoate transporter-like MFS transporter
MRAAGYSLSSALAFQVLLNVGAVIGGLSGAALADRWGSRWVATGFFGIAATAIYLMSQTPPSGVMWLVTMAAGAGSIGTQMVLFGYVATHYPEAVRATAVGVTSGVGRLGAVCGPTLGGWLLSNGASFSEAFAAFAAVAGAGALASLAVPARPRSRLDIAPAGRSIQPEGQHA